MPKSLQAILEGVDVFGHDVKVMYKGKDTFNTALGGLISVLVYVLTVIIAVRAIEEVVLMQDPSLTQYSK